MNSRFFVRVILSFAFSPALGFLLAYLFTLNVSNFEGGRGIAQFYLGITLSVFSFFVLLASSSKTGIQLFKDLGQQLINVNHRVNESPSSKFCWWLYPAVFGGIVVLWFLLILNGYHSLSHKLDFIIPFLVAGNIMLIIYVYIKSRIHITKTMFASIPCLALSFLWCVAQLTR